MLWRLLFALCLPLLVAVGILAYPACLPYVVAGGVILIGWPACFVALAAMHQEGPE